MINHVSLNSYYISSKVIILLTVPTQKEDASERSEGGEALPLSFYPSLASPPLLTIPSLTPRQGPYPLTIRNIMWVKGEPLDGGSDPQRKELRKY